jgi:hypothetical protein
VLVNPVYKRKGYTKLFKRVSGEGRMLTNNYPEDWKKFDLVNVVCEHEKLSQRNVKGLFMN